MSCFRHSSSPNSYKISFLHSSTASCPRIRLILSLVGFQTYSQVIDPLASRLMFPMF
ncbi:hypothetical protein B0T26DRAFT_729346 [Lasiosphaeria miniovina]|uniref:Uncharacterized protein n=1 Tax=Lasiosphaeria miniovina TaxID=1954250 RepID=A0AA39ZSQ2_9PEZI|nr:uncharacterized protein B0T26DRAFT_729346 [Lasiosphaeria miniovina]KAK0702943.1 hypothetical protein B0T26DRAFT_729346 [Lasiosphaeria miniovina]